IRKLSILFAIVVCIFANVVSAQPTTGTIEGTIKLDSGEVLPNAHLVAENEQTGLKREAVTSADAFYRFSALPPGTYTVSVDLKNFAGQSRTGIVVVVGQTVKVDFTMKIAATETVTVASQEPLVDVTKSSVGLPVTEKQIQNLPLNSRNFQELASLVPGASP